MSDLCAAVVESARTWCGTPFRHQGRQKGVGIDCVGLIYMLAKEFDLADTDETTSKAAPFVRYSRVPADGQMRLFCNTYFKKARQADLRPADIILMNLAREEGHVALYTGEGTIIHALSLVGACTEHSLDHKWTRRMTGFYRYPALCN